MKAITLIQPWATLIAMGHKRYETRSWAFPYHMIGQRIAIHAGAKVDWAYAQDPAIKPYIALSLMPTKAIVATATLLACWETAQLDYGKGVSHFERMFGDFGRGRYAWELGDVQRLATPVPCRGMLGLWEVPDKVKRQVPTEIRWAYQKGR